MRCKKAPLQVLIADDQPVTLEGLTRLLQRWGYETVSVRDGAAAWEVLERENAPPLALLDRQMPGFTGDEICRMARAQGNTRPLYIILLTASALSPEDKVLGLTSGADDYLSSPFFPAELKARLQIAERILKLETDLRDRVSELERALMEVKQLRGLLPICMDCKRIRDDHNDWHQVDHYMARRSFISFTHSICPKCLEVRMKQLAEFSPIKEPALTS